MVSITATVNHDVGLHARPASDLVRLANSFRSKISLSIGGKRANAKSILQVLGLGAGKGSQVTIETDGEDEQAAAEALAAMVECRQGKP